MVCQGAHGKPSRRMVMRASEGENGLGGERGLGWRGWGGGGALVASSIELVYPSMFS